MCYVGTAHVQCAHELRHCTVFVQDKWNSRIVKILANSSTFFLKNVVSLFLFKFFFYDIKFMHLEFSAIWMPHMERN